MGAASDIDFIAITHALRGGDVDAAIRLGLLDWDGDVASLGGVGLSADDIALLCRVHQERLVALAARDRYRARAARLARRKAEREAARTPPPSRTDVNVPALPTAAADVLARALAKAAARKP